MVSIAMTTYNGEKYIRELLDSLMSQSLTPDEIVIYDDCSTDDTCSIIKEYISKYVDINWCFHINSQNIGWRKNFRNSIFNCKGDYIFLCDQDDIWEKTKIEKMKSILENNNEIEVIASNYDVIYDGRKEKIRIKNVNKNDGTIKKVMFGYKSLYPLRPGCTFALKKSMVNEMKKYDLETSSHDEVIWNLAILRDSLYIYNKKNIKYRRHIDSASTPKEHLNLKRRINEVSININCAFFYKNVAKRMKEKKKSEILEIVEKFNTLRKNVLESESLFKLLLFQLKNFNMYPTFRNFMSDTIVVIKNKINF